MSKFLLSAPSTLTSQDLTTTLFASPMSWQLQDQTSRFYAIFSQALHQSKCFDASQIFHHISHKDIPHSLPTASNGQVLCTALMRILPHEYMDPPRVDPIQAWQVLTSSPQSASTTTNDP